MFNLAGSARFARGPPFASRIFTWRWGVRVRGISCTDMQTTVGTASSLAPRAARSIRRATGSPGGTRFSRNYVNVTSPTLRGEGRCRQRHRPPDCGEREHHQDGGRNLRHLLHQQPVHDPELPTSPTTKCGCASGTGISLAGNSVEQSVIASNKVYSWATGIVCAGYRHRRQQPRFRVHGGHQHRQRLAVPRHPLNHITGCTTGVTLANNAVSPRCSATTVRCSPLRTPLPQESPTRSSATTTGTPRRAPTPAPARSPLGRAFRWCHQLRAQEEQCDER